MEEGKKELKIEEKNDSGTGKLLAVIRISGMVKVNSDIKDTLDRLRLRRKYSCVLINSGNKNIIGMLKKVKYYIAYGEINDETLGKLVKERGESVEGRKKKIEIDVNGIVKGLKSGMKLKDFGIKGFFRLHPPRKGIKSKLQFPKGVLGNNKNDINKLIWRMI